MDMAGPTELGDDDDCNGEELIILDSQLADQVAADFKKMRVRAEAVCHHLLLHHPSTNADSPPSNPPLNFKPHTL